MQSWMFNQLGQSLTGDFFIAFGLQFFSFRKKAFFNQLLSFINVGSFTRTQILFLFLGSFIGMGFSTLIMMTSGSVLGPVLCLSGIVIHLLFRKTAVRHAGLAFGILGFFLFFLSVFYQYIQNFSFDIQQNSLEFFLFFCFIVLTTLFLRTTVGFLISLSAFYSFFGLDIFWFPLLFFLHWLLSLFEFYRTLIRGHQRLYFAVWTMGLFQVLQLILCQILFSFVGDSLELFFQGEQFLSGFKICILTYFIYFAVTPLFILPFAWISVGRSWLKPGKYEQVSQKIIFHGHDGGGFSPHLSLFLLKQEFKKYVIIVHTLFKLSREVNAETGETNKRLDHYQEISTRVAREIKQFCSGIGGQKFCHWQSEDVMRRYHQVDLIEQLTKDLFQIISMLREEKGDTEKDRECRFWLGLQFKLFEKFLNVVIGMEERDKDKVQAVLEKSYESLDRLFSEDRSMKVSSQTFNRVTESIKGLLA